MVLSLHWGTEWQDTPDDLQLSLARSLTASKTGDRPDVDLILGTHAHVPQAYEKVNGTWVVYGMGDQIAGEMTNHDGAHDPRGNQSTVGRFTFSPPPAPAAAGRSPAPSSCPSSTTSTPAGSSTSTRPSPRAPNCTPSATASATWCSAGARPRTVS